jgi:KaiC/GvpD/RAD55 family RecA-like ATPase
MSEQNILAAVLQDRSAYDAIADFVDADTFNEQGGIIYEAIAEYYKTDNEAAFADPHIVAEDIGRSLAADKHKQMFATLVANLDDTECSPKNIVRDFIEHRRHVAGQALAAALVGGDEESIQRARKVYEDYDGREALGEDSDDGGTWCGAELRSVLGQAYDPANLIRVYPKSLNDRLEGGLKRGHHMVIFARPEMGKTMTVINMMCGFAEEGRKVLYCGNEDPMPDIIMRTTSRLTGRTKYEVLEDLDGADAVARERGYENITFRSLSPGTPREIETLLKEVRPDVLVLDQLRNLDMKNDHFTQALEAAAKEARAWAKRYDCVVVSVTQAGDSASGKSILDLGDCDSSNTGIPATADVMLGIGATDAHVQRGEVVFSLPKNKVSGRHEFFSVQANPVLSKLTSLE